MPPAVLGNDPAQPSTTIGWKLNHLALRISDPVATTRFYRDLLGMRTIVTVNRGSFSIFYFGYPEGTEGILRLSEMPRRRREGLVEFIHIHVFVLQIIYL
jgi:lactoylglutathione lyase